MVELLLTGCDVEVEEGAFTREQSSRHRAILKGQEQPREHLSKEELIQQAKALKAPAAQAHLMDEIKTGITLLEEFVSKNKTIEVSSAN